MHIKFVSKKNLLHPHGTTFCLRKCAPGAIFWHFLAKFWALFEKTAGRSTCIVAGHTPHSRGINFYIERVSHNNIGRRGVPKTFWRKKQIFFWTSFFLIFSSEIFLWTNPHFLSKKKTEILAGKTACFFFVWSTMMPASFRTVFSVGYDSFWKSVKLEMLQNNFWSPRKKT